jgi:UDP-N-acetylglucosamine pyrophosphorylase
MGYTMNPVMLAVFALSGKDAAFETAFRTPMDIKGGVLVAGPDGRMTCADIGPAIRAQDVLAFEAAGKTILFNCGIGLFDLDRLVPQLESLPYRIPLRITDQDKDAGLYAQAEQITWEIIGLLDDPLFFAVHKTERFIAAKLLMETLSTSLPRTAAGVSDIGGVSLELNRGLERLLETEYLLRKSGNRWIPAE